MAGKEISRGPTISSPFYLHLNDPPSELGKCGPGALQGTAHSTGPKIKLSQPLAFSAGAPNRGLVGARWPGRQEVGPHLH